MKHLTLIFSILLSSFASAGSYSIANISGVVLDADLQEPIPYANIVINDLEGNLISGNVSNDDGTFDIEKIPAGKYILKVQFMGYKTFTQELEVSQSNTNIQLGSILLEADLAQLEEVNIVAERSTIEQRIDRKVINVGKDLTTTGASAADIMNNVPSVNVDQNGNIALRGNSNVRILVDGKPTNIEPAQLLKQIPSSSIKQIELITNPSAKYNPEGMSGIINIILHKNANDGFNGNLNTGVTIGENTRFNGSLDLNYRKGKWNFYGNFGSNLGKREHYNDLRNLDLASRQAITIMNDNESYLYKLGIDFYLNDYNTFSFYTNQNLFNGDIDALNKVSSLNNPSSNYRQYMDLNLENTNATYNFVYKRTFDKEGQELDLELDFNQFDEEETLGVTFSDNPAFLPYYENVHLDQENITANLDFVNPIGENMKLEIGAEARVLGREEAFRPESNQSENFDYEYNRDIYSFYTTFGQSLNKWSYQLGARLERFETDASVDGAEVYEDSYLTLYPSGFVNFTPTDNDSYQLSYSRRVDRPSPHQVSPIREISTPTITILGNPELDPQFTNSMEFNYTRKLLKGSLTGGVFFRNINDIINQVINEDPSDPDNLIISYGNFDDSNAYGLELNSTYNLTPWWNTNVSFELYNQEQRGLVGLEYHEVENTTFNARMNNSFKITEALRLQLFGYYRAKSEELQFVTEPFYFFNLGGRYSFLDDRASISLNFNDVFNTQEFMSISEQPYNQELFFKGETQTVYLGFSYRFGGSKNRALQRKERDDNETQGGGMF